MAVNGTLSLFYSRYFLHRSLLCKHSVKKAGHTRTFKYMITIGKSISKNRIFKLIKIISNNTRSSPEWFWRNLEVWTLFYSTFIFEGSHLFLYLDTGKYVAVWCLFFLSLCCVRVFALWSLYILAFILT